MSALQTFRHYRISQDPKGGAVEVWRSGGEVVCLAVDILRQVFVELHVTVPEPSRARDQKQFQQAAAAAAQLRHPHLISVLDQGEDEGANYYVTEFIDGERLDTYLARCNPIPSWLALQVLTQIVDGLQPLAGQPRLLAGVDIFNSSIQLLGETPADLLVKVCDLSLGEEPPRELIQQTQSEGRALLDCARLLHYMLTGNMKETPLSSGDARQLAPEFGFLIEAVLESSHSHHVTTLEQFRSLLERWRKDLPSELAALPDRLPSQLRPRLPLQAHFVQPGALAEYLSEDYQVDATPFDALQPYRHQATARATRAGAMIQLLPPERLMPREYVKSLRTALERINNLDHPHLLRVVAYWESENPEFFIEEAPGRLTISQLVKLKGGLNSMETVIVLEHLLEASRQAEACGLTPVLRSPSQLFLQFTAPHGEVPHMSDSDMVKTPLGEWPAFRVRVRTHLICLNLTQPERFCSEHLLPSSHPSTELVPHKQSSHFAPPTVRDFAVLANYLLATNPETPDKVRHLVYDYLGNRRAATQGGPKEFVERLAAAAGKTSAAKPAATAKKTVSTRRRKAAQSPDEELLAEEMLDAETGSSPSSDTPEFVLGRDSVLPSSKRPGAPAPGFAEALFGAPPLEELDLGAPAQPHIGPAHPDRNILDGPLDPSPDPDDLTYLDDPPPRRMHFFLLFLLVVLIAGLIAAVAAHLSGHAIWQSK